jgi:hypothetical protein
MLCAYATALCHEAYAVWHAAADEYVSCQSLEVILVQDILAPMQEQKFKIGDGGNGSTGAVTAGAKTAGIRAGTVGSPGMA